LSSYLTLTSPREWTQFNALCRVTLSYRGWRRATNPTNLLDEV